MPADFIWKAPIELFWQVRNEQTQKQIEAGVIDAGTRGSVTGGKHMDGLTAAVANLFRSDPEVVFDIHYGGRLSLPGYYRRFDLSFANFEAAIAARIAYIKALPDDAFPGDMLPV